MGRPHSRSTRIAWLTGRVGALSRRRRSDACSRRPPRPRQRQKRSKRKWARDPRARAAVGRAGVGMIVMPLKELIKAIAVELVDHPDQVVVTEIASEHN